MDLKSYIPMLPFMGVVLFLLYGPVAVNFVGSFTSWAGKWPSLVFAGTTHYGDVVTHRTFVTATLNTVKMLVIIVPSVLGLGLITSILLDQKPFGEQYIRVLILLPFAIAAVVSSTFWGWIFNLNGTINVLLENLGLGYFASSWTGDSAYSIYAVMVVIIWKYLGYVSIIFLGGVKSIPEDHYRSAKAFGASGFQLYKKVVIPQLKGTTITAGLITAMFSIKCFGIVWVLTHGGPGISSYVYPVLIYEFAFNLGQFSFSAAASILMFVLTTGLAALYLYVTKGGLAREVK